MKYSKLFGKAVKTITKEASSVSHKLLYKGGFIRQISTGRYAFLPLGLRVWEKIIKVIEDEMQSMGCQRLAVPTLHPIDIWKITNRDVAFGEEMHIVDDHHGARFAMGATAEGVMVELIKNFQPSYRDLPILVYQFSQKFRDDKRPRGGLLRVREFTMKDAYSFCCTEEESLEIYQKFYTAYINIAKNLDLEVIPVEADSGAIGGDYNHEFIVLSEAGEGSIFVCDKCGYSASVDRAEFDRPDLTPDEKEKPLKIIDQPEWVTTMEDNKKHYGEPAYKYLKNVVYKTSTGDFVVAAIRGDQDVNEAKLAKSLGGVSLESASDEDLEKLGTKPGYVHSWGLSGVTYVGDIGLTEVKNFIGGQKTETTDSTNVNYGRDFEHTLADIAEAKDGDSCVRCASGKLSKKKGIEYGHCFKQDLFYTEPHKGYFVDQDGVEKPLWMGAYGIGVGRALATVVEIHHDDKGILWPKNIAPYQIHLVGLNLEKLNVRGEVESVYETLSKKGYDVLYDDRVKESPGEKLATADLIGIPVRLVVSEKSLAAGGVEFKLRSEDKVEVLSTKLLLKKLSNT